MCMRRITKIWFKIAILRFLSFFQSLEYQQMCDTLRSSILFKKNSSRKHPFEKKVDEKSW